MSERGVVLHTSADGTPIPEDEMNIIRAFQQAAEEVHGVPFDERHDPSIAIGCEKCERLSCVCSTIADHGEECKYRKAVTCAVAIECDHGYDVCPTCDPCTCKATA